ncbi:BRISC and BRCA1-A complex member 2-like [Daphnia carinata]|uniref:BRISC and BRCA1-A complex member 2-like n=1 Tax=Daphnia carinata TaxID=120202 RepID=UPI0025804EE0|nr:BRISC and BRCA1-A complex member 2-like [Daphnia carinata]
MNEEENSIHPAFFALVEKALASEFKGGPVELIKVASEADFVHPHSGHYFTFRLPFSGKCVDWEIIFDPENPAQPPDFLCMEDINCDPGIYCQMVQFWDSQQSDCLVELLPQLNKIYKRYQVSQIMTFSKSAQIYQSLVNSGVKEENIEACYLPKERKFHFLIKLNTSSEGLPITKELGSSLIYAGLLYSLGMDGKILTHSLIISPCLGHILGSYVDQLQLTFSASQTVDVNVLHEFNATLDRVLNKVRQKHKRGREIVSALLGLYPSNVVFYDEDLYSEITLLFKWDDARYVAHLESLELEGETKLYLFAIDCPVKTSKDENIPYTETETVTFTHKPSSPGFSKHLHKTLSSKIRLFINRAKKHVSST